MWLAVTFWWALVIPVVFLVCSFWWRAGRRWVGLAAKWGCIIGFAGLAIGLLGAYLWAPDANQEFLLGIFVTGPLAFAATATTLLVVGAVKSRGPMRGPASRA